MTIRATPLDELMAICQGEANSAGKVGSSVEAEIKSRLRKVGGKAADFVPYLMGTLIELGGGVPSNIKKMPSISEALALVESSLGSKAAEAVSIAFAKYLADYDVSYKLKSA